MKQSYLQEFFRKLGERLNKSIDDDIFLPVYSQRYVRIYRYLHAFTTYRFFFPYIICRIIDSDPEARSFVTQQFRSGLKVYTCVAIFAAIRDPQLLFFFQLFSNIFLFHGVLSNAALVELAVERLLNRYLLVPLRTSHNRSDSAQRCVEVLFPYNSSMRSVVLNECR